MSAAGGGRHNDELLGQQNEQITGATTTSNANSLHGFVNTVSTTTTSTSSSIVSQTLNNGYVSRASNNGNQIFLNGSPFTPTATPSNNTTTPTFSLRGVVVNPGLSVGQGLLAPPPSIQATAPLRGRGRGRGRGSGRGRSNQIVPSAATAAVPAPTNVAGTASANVANTANTAAATNTAGAALFPSKAAMFQRIQQMITSTPYPSTLVTTTASASTPQNPTSQLYTAVPPAPVKGKGVRGRRAAAAATIRQSNYGNTVPLPNGSSASVSSTPPPRVLLGLPPSPPDWKRLYDETVSQLVSFSTHNVSQDSVEFKTLQSMLYPLDVQSIDRVMNPDLWRRFLTTRKELLRLKSRDYSLLSSTGLDEMEVLRAEHINENWNQDPSLNTPYSDNMALLFHCTRSASNLDAILTQGLDERLGNSAGGLLGRGIYFADNPSKSIQYDGHQGQGNILIFGVLLGDILCVDHCPNKHTFVREPEKTQRQKRNHQDLFFDSIVARPAGNNEYVIYNRGQSYPFYKVSYNRTGFWGGSGGQVGDSVSDYTISRDNLPPMAWGRVRGAGDPMSIPDSDKTPWPFYASTVFNDVMGVEPELLTSQDSAKKKDENHNNATVQNGPATPEVITIIPELSEEELEPLLSELEAFGFCDKKKNKELLKTYDYDLNRTVNHLLDQKGSVVMGDGTGDNFQDARPGSSRNINNGNGTRTPLVVQTSAIFPKHALVDLAESPANSPGEVNKKVKLDLDKKKNPTTVSHWLLGLVNLNESPSTSEEGVGDDKDEDCQICCNTFKSSSPIWKTLSCTHRLCNSCHSTIELSRTTMDGVPHTSVRCPFCQFITGVELGTCPNGKMTVQRSAKQHCQGYEKHGTITINYTVTSPQHSLQRICYLPKTPEGEKLLKLLLIAWNRRLIFSIGTSLTTGIQNTLVWNIHHKTSLNGGVAQHGYPDPGYLDRLALELKAYGIE